MTANPASYVTDKPDTHAIMNGELGMFRLPGGTITTLTLVPGWKYQPQNLPVLGQASAEALLNGAAGYLQSGHIRVQLRVGMIDLRAGSSFSFPEGDITDAEVIGSTEARCILFTPRWAAF